MPLKFRLDTVRFVILPQIVSNGMQLTDDETKRIQYETENVRKQKS